MFRRQAGLPESEATGVSVRPVDPLQAVGEVLDLLEEEPGWRVPPSAERDGLCHWIASPLPAYLDGLRAALEFAPGKRYLEVGSGIGTRSSMAYRVGFDVTGLEIRPEYADVARRFVPECEFVVGDALSFNGYGDFDVVYTYEPMHHPAMRVALCEQFTRYMRPDAVLIHLFHAGDMRERGWRSPTAHTWVR